MGTGGVLEIGVGAVRVLGVPGSGRVLAVYRRAAYLRTDGGIAALTTAAAPRGPLHVRCLVLPPCRAGERFATDGHTVRGTRWALRLEAPIWRGTLPPAAALVGAVTAAEVAGYAATLGGRGPGLTPAGDDVLAGLLLVAHAAGSAADRARLAALAGRVPTNAIAAAFLRCAAHGQCIEPAHDVLHALAVHGADAEVPESARLSTIGASSGRALLAGIRIGLDADRRDAARASSTMINVHLSSSVVER